MIKANIYSAATQWCLEYVPSFLVLLVNNFLISLDNRMNKQLFEPAAWNEWAVVIFENKSFFGEKAAYDMIKALRQAANSAGVQMLHCPYYTVMALILYQV